jgi:hypothetical protein
MPSRQSLIFVGNPKSLNLVWSAVSCSTRVDTNEGESGASFCCQVAAFFPNIFYNFYLGKNHTNAKNSRTF